MKLLFTLLFSLILFPQQSSEKIFWKENQKLTWQNFNGKSVPSAGFVASTNSGISFQYSYSIKNNDVTVNFTVQSFFDPSDSWYMPEKVNDHILKHEQAHFDISEIHARLLRKNLEGKKFTKRVKLEVETIYNQVEQKRRAMQTKFDAETDHSRLKEKEAFWQQYIAKQLSEYESWK